MKTTRSYKCKHDGCMEYGHYSFETKKEAREHAIKYGGEYRCSRHRNMETILSPISTTRTKVLSAKMNNGRLYWRTETGGYGSGLISGPGFKAWAHDFPEGTTIRVTAEITLPPTK